MSYRTPKRLLTISIWGSLALTVGVCALGIRLTVRQYQGMEGVLLDLERRAAEPDRAALGTRIEELETEVLDSLEKASTQEDREAVRERFPFVALPFAITNDGSVAAHGLRPTNRPTSGYRVEPPPQIFQETLRIVHSTESLETKRGALDRLVAHEDLDASWRLRAEMQLAAFRRHHQEPEAAAKSYADIADRSVAVGAKGEWAPVYHASLAEAESRRVLTASSPAHTNALRAAITRGLAFLESPDRGTTLVEDEFFVEGAREFSPLLARDLVDRLDAASRHISSTRVRHSALDSVRELVRASSGIPESERVGRRTVTGTREGAVPTVWRLGEIGAPIDASPARPLAVGFQVDPERLATTLDEWLDERDPANDLVVTQTERRSADATSEIVPLAPLEGEWRLISLAKNPDVWSTKLSRAQRPFLVAGFLLGALGLTLVGGLLLFYRGVRREMALARMKTEFVANVSHELKTPLALIRLCSETLELGRLGTDEQRNKYYGVITRESERLTHLIGNVLNFASIEAGKKDYARTSQNLAPVLRQTVEAYFLQFREKGFECSSDIPEELPAVLADEEAVAQALINLLQNAVRYSPEEKSIHVRAHAEGCCVPRS